MLLDHSLAQFYFIDDLFDDSKVLQLLPTCLESACFQILDRRFQCRHFLPLRPK